MTLATALGTIAIVGAAVILGVIADRLFGTKPEDLRDERAVEVSRKRGLVRVRRSDHVPPLGNTPATAIRAGADQLARLRTAQHCAECRGEMTYGDDDHVRYDDRTLLVLRLACTKCGARRALYVATTSTSDPQ